MKSKLPQILPVVGIILLIVSVVWWAQTFGVDFDHIKCLASSSGVCQLSKIGGFFGSTVYNPIIFWIGLICLIAGIVLKKFRIL